MLQSEQTGTLLPRRRFLQATGAVVLAASARGISANDAIADESAPQPRSDPFMKLSLAAYSFNRQLPRHPSPQQLAVARMRLENFIEFCAEQNLHGTELTSYYMPEFVNASSVDASSGDGVQAQDEQPASREKVDAYLNTLKNLCFRSGLDISGTAIGNDFCLPEGPARQRQLAHCKHWIDNAAVLGAPVIRIFAGKVPRGDSEDAAIQRCVAGINECLEHAAKRGVILALENHGGITSTPAQMLKIMSGVAKTPWFGVNFDSGNFRTDDPYRDLEKIAPYAVNAQIKAAITKNGNKHPADLKRIVHILKSASYRGYVVLEYEEKADPTREIPRYLDQLRELISSER